MNFLSIHSRKDHLALGAGVEVLLGMLKRLAHILPGTNVGHRCALRLELEGRLEQGGKQFVLVELRNLGELFNTCLREGALECLLVHLLWLGRLQPFVQRGRDGVVDGVFQVVQGALK